MSIVALSIMGILFFSETAAFARSKIVTSIAIDENTNPQLRLNFNITMLDVHCDYVTVDVWDALGTNRQNVTKNVEKWQISEDGGTKLFSGRNREQRAVRHEEHDRTLEEMHEEDGEHADELTKDDFKDWLNDHPMAFVDMFAPWCASSRARRALSRMIFL